MSDDLPPYVIFVPSSGGFWHTDRQAEAPCSMPAESWPAVLRLPESHAPPEQRPNEGGKDE